MTTRNVKCGQLSAIYYDSDKMDWTYTSGQRGMILRHLTSSVTFGMELFETSINKKYGQYNIWTHFILKNFILSPPLVSLYLGVESYWIEAFIVKSDQFRHNFK